MWFFNRWENAKISIYHVLFGEFMWACLEIMLWEISFFRFHTYVPARFNRKICKFWSLSKRIAIKMQIRLLKVEYFHAKPDHFGAV